jgi:Xaa-Pro aminopeptidase
MSRAILIGLAFLQTAVAFSEDNACYAARRKALMAKIGSAVAVLQGAPDTRAYTAFRQDNNFYYLTGVEVPDALLLLDGSQNRSILFLPGRNQESERWEGARLLPGTDARRRTGIDEVLDLDQFGSELEKRAGALRVLYVPFSPQETAATSRDRALEHDSARQRDPWDGRSSRESAFENSLKVRLGPSVQIRNLAPAIDGLRRVKDAQEIELLRRAGSIGALGMKEAIRTAKPGMFEYQVAATAEYHFSWQGASGPAFHPIVGSGPNSCMPHYGQNRRRMAAGDIAVFDFGPDYRYYQADITRTFPVSGRFTEEQAKAYQAVLDAQTAALERVRPGATFEALNEAVQGVLDRHGYARYQMHAVSNYVGMSVHDVGDPTAFEPGVVIAVEPGIYIPERNLGVRIEDTVLVTQDGCEVLTKEVPKEIRDIEALMSGKHLRNAAAKE